MAGVIILTRGMGERDSGSLSGLDKSTLFVCTFQPLEGEI